MEFFQKMFHVFFRIQVEEEHPYFFLTPRDLKTHFNV